MLIVTGSITARAQDIGPLKQASLDHVRRSRTEPGCISHSVQVDCENPLRLFFFERWTDRTALAAHFKQPGSAQFIQAVRDFAAENTGPEIYEAEPAAC